METVLSDEFNAHLHTAADVLRERTFDVFVGDIGVPGQGGYAFLRAVRGRTPAAALTAYARTEDRTRPRELLVVIANLAGRFGTS